MEKIRSRHITLGFMLVSLGAVTLVLGCLNHWFWLPAAGFLAGYLALDRKQLRCPHCGGFTNLDRLLYARKHPYHCSRCGNRLEIVP